MGAGGISLGIKDKEKLDSKIVLRIGAIGMEAIIGFDERSHSKSKEQTS
jgi:hypothetical protein